MQESCRKDEDVISTQFPRDTPSSPQVLPQGKLNPVYIIITSHSLYVKLKSAEEDTELQLDADTLGVKNVCYISMKMKGSIF